MRGVPVLPVHRDASGNRRPAPPLKGAKVTSVACRKARPSVILGQPGVGKEVRATGRCARVTLVGPAARAAKAEEGAGKRPSTCSSCAKRTSLPRKVSEQSGTPDGRDHHRNRKKPATRPAPSDQPTLRGGLRREPKARDIVKHPEEKPGRTY
jgi:hypothetical protein